MRVVRKKLKGGKLLGQGLYGCAFTPELKCKEADSLQTPAALGQPQQQPLTEDKVGKLILPQDAQVELSMSRRLQSLPNASEYFVIVESLCTPKPRAEQTEPDIPKCEALQGKPITAFRQVTMPYGGKPLRNIRPTVANIDIFKLSQHLLEATTLLLKARIVHTDLHQLNILCHQRNKCRFIDFGLAWSPDTLTLANLKDLERTFNPAIAQEPPEVSYIQGMINNVPEYHIYARIQDQKPAFQLAEMVFSLSKKEQIESLKKFVQSSWSIKKMDLFTFYKLYWHKIDAWGIGHVLLSLMVQLSNDAAFDTTPGYAEKINTFLLVVFRLLNTDPSLRINAAEALQLLNPESPVLQDTALQEWLKKLEAERAQIEKIAL